MKNQSHRFEPVRMSTHMTRDTPTLIRTVAAYAVCLGLVPLYVNLFPLWKYFSLRFGDEMFTSLPVLILVIMLVTIGTAIRRGSHRQNRTIQPWWIALGVMLCATGLVIPDPAFPVKRIHVAEYLLLSLIARFAMAPFLRGTALLFFSSCFAALLGMHDEFLQGIHPARTYGLRDMSVNALACFGGGSLGHGLSMFTSGSPDGDDTETGSRTPGTSLYLGWLLAGTLMLSVPAVYFRGMAIELWTIVPLLGSMVCYSLYRNDFQQRHRHGITALSCTAWSLACYPIVSGIGSVVFH